jgi:hypothetical protein
VLDLLVDATVLGRTAEGAFARFVPRRSAGIQHAA